MSRFERTDRRTESTRKTPNVHEEGHHPRARADDKPHNDVKDDGRDHPKQAVGEIRMITRGSVSGGSYKSLKKNYYRQINNVHIKHSSPKCRRSESDVITLSK